MITEERQQELLDTLTDEEKEMVYRHVWFLYVLEDVKSRAEDPEEAVTDRQAAYAARRYVYDGTYDCTASYWDNIDGVIKMAREMLPNG